MTNDSITTSLISCYHFHLFIKQKYAWNLYNEDHRVHGRTNLIQSTRAFSSKLFSIVEVIILIADLSIYICVWAIFLMYFIIKYIYSIFKCYHSSSDKYLYYRHTSFNLGCYVRLPHSENQYHPRRSRVWYCCFLSVVIYHNSRK